MVISDFETLVLPRIPTMSHGVLHYDACSRNIVVQKDKNNDFHVAGIFDFTDCIHCPHVFELAILISDMLSVWESDPVLNVASVISGYIHSLPLSQDDLQCLYTIVMARLCTIITVTTLNYECGEESTGYHSVIVEAHQKALDELVKYSKEEVNKIWLEAARQPTMQDLV